MISGGKRWAHLRLVSALTNLNLLGGGEGGGSAWNCLLLHMF